MKRYHHRLSAAALALIVCLSVSPVAAAAQPNLADTDFVRQVVRMFKKLQKKLTGIASLSDYPTPPKP